MAEGLSLLGLGSDNALNQDMIDKLKANEETVRIKPVEYQKEVALKQKEAVENISTKIEDIHKWVKILTNEETYNNKEVYTSSSIIGFEIQDMDNVSQTNYEMDVTEMAKKDIYQTNILTNLEDPITNVDTSMTVTINGKETIIDLTPSSTYLDLKEEINQIDGISAAFVKVTDSGEYRLKITSEVEGTNNAIVFSNVSSELETNLGLGESVNHLLSATNLQMTLDGVAIERQTNEVQDLITGVKMTIYSEGEIETQIKINVTEPVEAHTNFILEYNALMETITGYKRDLEDGERSVILGINEVTSGLREIKNALFSFNEGADLDNPEEIKSIFQAGFDLKESGDLSSKSIRKTYDIPDGLGGTTTHTEEFTFEQLVGSEPERFRTFFSGEGSPMKDVLTVLNGLVNIDGNTDESGNTNIGSFEGLITKYTEGQTAYEERIEELQEKLDSQYEQMQTRYAQYDTIMSNMNSSFASLELIIAQSTSSN
jgi:flagellar hook-associated protein 2